MPVLIAGPTASGKSALAMAIARRQGGVIVNADALQVYDCWRVLTARPSEEEEREVAHSLYGHVPFDGDYSVGHWLRDVAAILEGGQRPIIVGGTGLYFTALTEGLAEIPATPREVRLRGDLMSLHALLTEVDPETKDRIDTQNRARVQRAWEVLQSTGRGLAEWQADTPPPLLPLRMTVPLLVECEKQWLLDRMARRFDKMLREGALDEVARILPKWDPALPSSRAIGAPELVAYLRGETTLEAARDATIISTRRYAKRQRTWFRSKMRNWRAIVPSS